MIKMHFLCLICLVITGLLNPSVSEAAEETITIAFFEEPNQNPPFKWAELAYTEAFRRLGLRFRYVVFPPKRASMMSDTGEIDGEAARIESYGKDHPNLIRVEEPVLQDKVLAIVKDPSILINNWESLSGSKYKVEYYRGIVIAEKILSDIVDADSLTTISHPTLGLKRLNAKRIDVYVDNSIRLIPLLHSTEFSQFNLHIAAELAESTSYPYLHKRHANLAPKLAEVLRQMKAEGLIDQYFKDAHSK